MSVTLSAQDTPFKTKFLEQFADFKANLNGHSQEPLAIFCKDGHEALLQTDFPDRTVEDWKYSGSPIQRMLEQHYAPAGLAFVTKEQVQQWAIPDLAAISLVFVNGQLAASLSSDTSQLPDGLVIQTWIKHWPTKPLASGYTNNWRTKVGLLKIPSCHSIRRLLLMAFISLLRATLLCPPLFTVCILLRARGRHTTAIHSILLKQRQVVS
ncbi:MAG: hypothetical protein R2795_15645 [Saprospiraceae bacterium]